MDDANSRTGGVGGAVDCSVHWTVDYARVQCRAELGLGDRIIPIDVASRALSMRVTRLRRSTFMLTLWFVYGGASTCMPSSHCHAYDSKKLHGRDSGDPGSSRLYRSKIRWIYLSRLGHL